MHLPSPGSRILTRSCLAMIACSLLAVLPAHADITRTDMQVAARALSFVSNPLSGRVRVGIVYAANSPRSLRQARDLESMLAKGMKIGTLELQPVLVEYANAATSDVDLFFLTEHMASDITLKPSGDPKQQALCITTDIDQVRNGVCTLGVRSRPKVEVFVNRASAAANDITFSTVFRVMITEL